MADKRKDFSSPDEPPRNPRSILVLDGDASTRQAAEQLLREEEYWTLSTDDPRAALRLALVGATDLLAVDLSLGALETVPRWQRRQADVAPREAPPRFSNGYAVLRALQADPSCARFPMVMLRAQSADEEPVPRCRFGVVDYLPKASRPDELLQGLETIFRDVVQPALSREQHREAAEENGGAGNGKLIQFPVAAPNPEGEAEIIPVHARPFEAIPKALRTALLVDPDDAHRRFVNGVLSQHGFVVHETSTGSAAFRLAIARRPWLILSEVNLPDQSGFDLCTRIRSHSLLRRTPLAFLSDWDDYDKRYYGLKLGADDYLTKPVSVRELLIRLQLILKRYADLQPLAERGPGFHGGIDLVGAPGALQICHLNLLTGVLVARRGSQRVQIAFRQGEIVGASGDRLGGEELIYDFVAWSQGQFEFVPGTAVEGEPLGAFDQLLLEGCRRLDERRIGRANNGS